MYIYTGTHNEGMTAIVGDDKYELAFFHDECGRPTNLNTIYFEEGFRRLQGAYLDLLRMFATLDKQTTEDDE